MVQSTQEDQMDYCSSCRRHLNGALACPGCGAYAPDIAPPAHVYATTGTAATAWDEAPTWHDAGRHEEPAAATDPGLASEDVSDAPVVTEGRAARRRQRVRWKKNQRKAVVATAVALVGGGLTVSAMNQGSGTRAQAATAPDNRAMGVSELPTSDDSVNGTTAGDAHRSTSGTPATTIAKHRRTADSASTTGGSSVRTDSAGSPTPTARTAARSQSQSQSQSQSTVSTSAAVGADSATSASGSTTAQTPSSTAPTGSTSTSTGTSTTTTGSSTDTGTSSGTTQTSGSSNSSSSATDPAGLCVLNLLCIS
ncbi:SCO2400 family protein [Streptomyces griseorubiginosus]|uniref:SCO2400 family protein n=1 Tax=Streptomyces griseorubiginosus TaxID=67304 RepID=UPI0034529DE9